MAAKHDNDRMSDTFRSVHLSASAGSGKTRALTRRYLDLLNLLEKDGLGLDQAMAITFTDKAAAEIKKRVMDRLEEPMLKKIVRGRQDLRISTIHSFCMNLLKRYPLEAGLPPDFGILDDRDKAFLVRRAVEDSLEDLDADPSSAALAHFSADGLADAAGALLAVRSRLKRIEIDAGGPEQMERNLASGLAAAVSESELQSLIAGGELGRGLREMEAVLRTQPGQYELRLGRVHLELAGAAAPATAVPLAAKLDPVYFNKDGSPRKNPSIAKKDFRGGDRPAYEASFFRVQELLVRVRDLPKRITAAKEALGLLRLFQLADERYRLLKLREGALDFDDLEISAYRLLKGLESPDVLYWLDRKMLHYLVDEFQDTSDIQWAILQTLTAEIFAGQGAEKPQKPTLFVVGDRKQSIYRFREANYRLIDRVRVLIGGLPAGERSIETLDRNYRSAPEIVASVNRIFGSLWTGDYQHADADRADQRGSVRLIELAADAPNDDGSPLTEAQVLAREIRRLVGTDTAVYERGPDKSWTERRAGYGDCAVLIQSRTKLKEYEAALLDEGVPFRVVGGIGFYEEDEVQAVMNVLFFLWNREDRLSLAAALASPLFGLTDADLSGLLRNGGLIDGLRRERPGIAELLDGWASAAGLVPLAVLVHRIIGDTGAYVRFGRRSTQAVFNLDKLLDTAREFDRRGYTTLQDFVAWVKNIRSSELREAAADVILPGGGGDVSIMTVHKAKGLEYPVVFLPGMNQSPRSVTQGPPVIVEEEKGRLRMAADGPLYDELWSAEKAELQREQERLLYVAMTRARDHLVMIGTLGPKTPYKSSSWLASLRKAVPSEGAGKAPSAAVIRTALPEGTVLPEPPAPAPSTPRELLRRGGAVDGAKVVAALSPVAAGRVPEWKKATDLLEAGREWSLEQHPHREGAGLPPAARGNIYHRCLEELSSGGAFDLRAVAGGFSEFLALSPGDRERFLDDAAARIRSLTENEDLAWIFRHRPGAYAELPFLFRRGTEIVSGIIDRVVVQDGRGFVIDYKSTTVTGGGDVQTWIDHYRPQVRVYCEAVREIFALERVEGYLLFLDSGRLALAATAS